MTLFFTAAFSLLFGILSFAGAESESSWFIEESRFHMSVHGQISCMDCHDKMNERAIHPDPADVVKKISDRFSLDQCADCHDNIMADLEDGRHGKTEISDSKTYTYCLSCHDPHYQGADKRNPNENLIIDVSRDTCSTCHEYREKLPALSADDETCMKCHRAIRQDDPEGIEKLSGFCFYCHTKNGEDAEKKDLTYIPLINQEAYPASPHAAVACLACHPKSAGFSHKGISTDCLKCHLPHDEKIAHDAHFGVSCIGCHSPDGTITKDVRSGNIVRRLDRKTGNMSNVHALTGENGKVSCDRCHFGGNTMGAAAMVLPSKGILCMACHSATFSFGDTVTIVSSLLFILFLFCLISVWLTGNILDEKESGKGEKIVFLFKTMTRVLFSAKLFSVLKALFRDGLLQRRLFRQSKVRWIIHGLIFYPFVFRFTWGITALSGSIWLPEQAVFQDMLNKNHPICAFLFDLTGVMIIMGVVLAIIRRGLHRKEILPHLPKSDRLAEALIAGVILVGFILEGLRIAMTGFPDSASYAFLGHAIGLMMRNIQGIVDGYGYFWYAHAILTGAFVVYLPFSKMFHIFMAPVVLAMNAASDHGRPDPSIIN